MKNSITKKILQSFLLAFTLLSTYQTNANAQMSCNGKDKIDHLYFPGGSNMPFATNQGNFGYFKEIEGADLEKVDEHPTAYLAIFRLKGEEKFSNCTYSGNYTYNCRGNSVNGDYFTTRNGKELIVRPSSNFKKYYLCSKREADIIDLHDVMQWEGPLRPIAGGEEVNYLQFLSETITRYKVVKPVF